MRTALLMAGLLVSLAAMPQEIYRWVDKDGIVHYADQPGSPDAELITPSGIAVPPAEPTDTTEMLYRRDPRDTGAGRGQAAAYRSLTIASPEPDQVFFGADSVVNVRVDVGGRLRSQDELRIFLDGTQVPNVTGRGASISGLARGTYSVRAEIVGSDGGTLITSAPVTFYVRQPSIANPPTGPSVPPRPPLPGPRPTPLPSRGG